MKAGDRIRWLPKGRASQSSRSLAPELQTCLPQEGLLPLSDMGESHARVQAILISWLKELLLPDAWKITVWSKREKKKSRKKVRWGRGHCEGRRRVPPIPKAPVQASTLKGPLLPWPAGVFPSTPGLAPGHKHEEWCLSWKDLCRVYFDKTLILSPPLLPLNLSTSSQGLCVFVCLCVWGRGSGMEAG